MIPRRLLAVTIVAGLPVQAQESEPGANLAQQLVNPVASLISVPFQGNMDFGIGPTVLALRQEGPWTVGMLANHLWSYAGDDARAEVNATFLQPFASYITPTRTTFTLSSESTYDWTGDQWLVPMNFTISQLFRIGGQPLQAFVGGRYYLESPTGGPEWGLRFGITMLFPK
jgi:hypothetical protein